MPRRRPRLLPWSAATLTVAILLALLFSTRFQLYLSTATGYDMALLAGWLHLTYFDPSMGGKLRIAATAPTGLGLYWSTNQWQLKLNFAFDRDRSGWYVNIPLWCPLLLSATATAFLYRRSRHLPNLCPHCHYNLRGLPPSPTGQISCPECGKHHAPVK